MCLRNRNSRQYYDWRTSNPRSLLGKHFRGYHRAVPPIIHTSFPESFIIRRLHHRCRFCKTRSSSTSQVIRMHPRASRVSYAKCLPRNLPGGVCLRINRKHLASSIRSRTACRAPATDPRTQMGRMDPHRRLPNDCGNHPGQDLHRPVHPAHPRAHAQTPAAPGHLRAGTPRRRRAGVPRRCGLLVQAARGVVGSRRQGAVLFGASAAVCQLLLWRFVVLPHGSRGLAVSNVLS